MTSRPQITPGDLFDNFIQVQVETTDCNGWPRYSEDGKTYGIRSEKCGDRPVLVDEDLLGTGLDVDFTSHDPRDVFLSFDIGSPTAEFFQCAIMKDTAHPELPHNKYRSLRKNHPDLFHAEENKRGRIDVLLTLFPHEKDPNRGTAWVGRVTLDQKYDWRIHSRAPASWISGLDYGEERALEGGIRRLRATDWNFTLANGKQTVVSGISRRYFHYNKYWDQTILGGQQATLKTIMMSDNGLDKGRRAFLSRNAQARCWTYKQINYLWDIVTVPTLYRTPAVSYQAAEGTSMELTKAKDAWFEPMQTGIVASQPFDLLSDSIMVRLNGRHRLPVGLISHPDIPGYISRMQENPDEDVIETAIVGARTTIKQKLAPQIFPAGTYTLKDAKWQFFSHYKEPNPKTGMHGSIYHVTADIQIQVERRRRSIWEDVSQTEALITITKCPQIHLQGVHIDVYVNILDDATIGSTFQNIFSVYDISKSMDEHMKNPDLTDRVKIEYFGDAEVEKWPTLFVQNYPPTTGFSRELVGEPIGFALYSADPEHPDY